MQKFARGAGSQHRAGLWGEELRRAQGRSDWRAEGRGRGSCRCHKRGWRTGALLWWLLLGAQHSPKAAATPTRQVSWGALLAPPGVWCCTRAKESQAPAARGTLPSELRALTWAGAAGLQKTLAAPRSHQHHCFVPLQADVAWARLWHSRWSHTHVGAGTATACVPLTSELCSSAHCSHSTPQPLSA